MNLGSDVVITITGIVLVFAILVLLMLIIMLEGKIFDSMNAKKKAAKEAAKALGIECITLNASELASQLAEETAAPADLRFPALLAAADRLGIQYIATGHRARVETGADGVHVLCPAEIADESARLAALPQETLGRLILPLGDFSPADVAEMAAE